MGDLASVPIGDRLARYGLVAVAERLLALDERIVADAPLATEHSIARLKRWLDAGEPAADLDRLVYVGDDEVRALLLDTLAGLPTPIKWHALEWVVWREIGRSAAGMQAAARPRRDPPGDDAHEIMLLGSVSDDELPGLIGHELGHSWHAIMMTEHSEHWPLPMSRVERRARRILLGRGLGIDEEQIARMEAYVEALCDRTALAWGLQRTLRPLEQLRRARVAVNEAAELVPSIERACAIRGTP